MKPEELVRFLPADFCLSCMEPHSLILIDYKKNRVPLQKIINDNTIIDNSVYTEIVCGRCGKRFKIDWSKSDRIPRALTDYLFYNKYFSY